ncbi:MAG: germination protein YpeB [Oscillospiraceae bacterium]|jgi:germination protein YpeB|nr:germination protein YpeB [Oscillospiraceae bacterium]
MQANANNTGWKGRHRGRGAWNSRSGGRSINKPAIALTALLVASVVLIAWQTSRAEKLKRSLEVARQQAFYSLVDGLNSVELNLSKLMVSSTPGEGALLLSRVSMQAGEASSSLAQLPLSGEPIASSMKFVNQVSDYARTLTASAAEGRPFSDDDMKQLQGLLSHASTINRQLSEMMATVPNDWWSQSGEQEQAPLVRAMDTQNASEYPSLIYDGPFSDGKHEGEAKALGSEQVDADEALRRAIAFVGADKVTLTARTSDTGGPVASYGFVLDTTDGRLNVHVTQRGGKVLWIMPEYGEYTQSLSMQDCVARASEYLAERGFSPMESNYFQQYNGLAVINFAWVQDGVVMYPDLIKVQVRMDTGAVVGIEANNYLMNHYERALPEVVLNVEQAREMVSDRLDVTHERLCVIPRESGEKLAYEFIGKWSDSEFIIYIDALTGAELQILKIIDAENGVLTV